MDIVLRHRSASGDAMANRWELDVDGALLVCIQVGGAEPVSIPIRIASVRTRRRDRGEFAIMAISGSGECWRVEHGTYDAHLPAPHPRLPDLCLLLANAPPDVAARLAEIAAG
jgi:hypothetical protein